ncbi:MAG: hypothetical protein H0U66_06575 [Gemmatimonadaceae bacterium]|nr:hypothetical protein [Gemmatimonadaceae bacterium]
MTPSVDCTPLAPQPSIASQALGSVGVMSAPSIASQTLGDGNPMPSDATGLDQQNVANAGYSNVPQFEAAPDLVEHHGWLHNALQSIGHGIQKGAEVYGDRVAGIDPELAKTLTPAQLQSIRSTAIFQDGLGTLDRQPDSRGFLPSTLEQLAKGLGAGRQAGQQAANNSVSVNNYLAQKTAAAALDQKRAALQAQFQINPSDTPEQADAKARELALGYAQIGDTRSLAALGQASSLFRQPKVAPEPNLQHVSGLIDPKTGKPAVGLMDARTGEVKSYLPEFQKPPGEGDNSDKLDKTISRVVGTFDHETKDFREAQIGFQTLVGGMSGGRLMQAQALNEGLNKLLNPGSIIRKSTMDLMEQAGGVSDRLRKYGQRLENGMIPADLANDIIATAKGVMSQRIMPAKAARKRAVDRLVRVGMSREDAEASVDDLATPGLVEAIAPMNTSTSGSRPPLSSFRGQR